MTGLSRRAMPWIGVAAAVLIAVGVLAVVDDEGTGEGGPRGPAAGRNSPTTAGRPGGVGSTPDPTRVGPPTSDASPSTDPDPTEPDRIAAAIIDDGGALVHMAVESGEVVGDIAQASEGTTFVTVATSASAGTLAVVQVTPGSSCRQPGTVLVALDGGPLRQVGSGDAVVVSPDGSQVAYTAGACEGVSDAVVVRNLADGSERRMDLAPRAGEPDGLVSSLVAWMPSGDLLSYVWAPDPSEPLQLLTLDLASGAVTETGVHRGDPERSWTALAGATTGTVLVAESTVDLERNAIRGELTERRLSDGAIVARRAEVSTVIADIAEPIGGGSCLLFVAGGNLLEQCGSDRRQVQTGVVAVAWPSR